MLTIIPYQSRWSDEFLTLGRLLRESLGRLALRIDHIGSTAVPGLAAKDIIDIQITVVSLDSEVQKGLERAGFVQLIGISRDHHPPGSVGPEINWFKWLFKSPDWQRKANIHVRVAGQANQRYPLLFRDYLRAHPATAQAYAELKQRLVENLADPQTYPDVKDPAVDLIYFAAEDWAAATRWQPGASDI
jgi:GrpB-like predicted nucleotidyltransferase (UPF0157 family)